MAFDCQGAHDRTHLTWHMPAGALAIALKRPSPAELAYSVLCTIKGTVKRTEVSTKCTVQLYLANVYTAVAAK